MKQQYTTIKKFENSAYAKHYPYPKIYSNKKTGKEDIVVFWYALTPNHKVSKHNAIMVLPQKDYPEGIHIRELMDKINNFHLPYLRCLRSGNYIWSRPLLYSGKVIH